MAKKSLLDSLLPFFGDSKACVDFFYAAYDVPNRNFTKGSNKMIDVLLMPSVWADPLDLISGIPKQLYNFIVNTVNEEAVAKTAYERPDSADEKLNETALAFLKTMRVSDTDKSIDLVKFKNSLPDKLTALITAAEATGLAATTVNCFKVNVMAVTKEYIKLTSKVEDDCGLSKLLDMSTGVQYDVKEGKLIVIKGDGKETEVGKPDKDNCKGSGLARCDDSDVATFISDCILNDATALQKNLAKLANANMFVVAEDEMKQLDAGVIIQVLRAFKFQSKEFRDPNYGMIRIPQDFNTWEQKVLPTLGDKTVVDAIQKNEQLKNYLKGVVFYVMQHPQILNRQLPSVVRETQLESNSTYLGALNKQRYYLNPTQGNSSSYVEAELSSNIMPVQVRKPRVAMRGPPVFGIAQFGGGIVADEMIDRIVKQSSSQMLGELMADLKEKMERVGVLMTDKDRDCINNAIAKLKEGENRLLKLYKMEKTIHDLAAYFNSTECGYATEFTTIDMERAIAQKDMLNYLNKQLSELNDCISENSTHNNTMTNTLGLKFNEIMSQIADPKSTELPKL